MLGIKKSFKLKRFLHDNVVLIVTMTLNIMYFIMNSYKLTYKQNNSCVFPQQYCIVKTKCMFKSSFNVIKVLNLTYR